MTCKNCGPERKRLMWIGDGKCMECGRIIGILQKETNMTNTFIEEKIKEFENEFSDRSLYSSLFENYGVYKDIKIFFTTALQEAMEEGKNQAEISGSLDWKISLKREAITQYKEELLGKLRSPNCPFPNEKCNCEIPLSEVKKIINAS